MINNQSKSKLEISFFLDHTIVEYSIILYNLLFQSLSVECGMSTGCLKIYKKAAQFDTSGEFIPPHKREADLQLFRGELSAPWSNGMDHVVLCQEGPWPFARWAMVLS